MTRDNDRFDLSRRTYLRGIAAATALGASSGAASAAVDPSTVVEVGEGSYTTQIPSGYGYATPMTSEDIFTTGNEEPPLPSNDWWSGVHLGYNVYDSYTYEYANGATVALPYYGYPSDLGLSLQIPNNWKGRWQGQELPPSKLANMDDEAIPRLFVGHSGTSSFADTRVHEYGDWSVTARWGDGAATGIDMTMVRGTPMVFCEYQGGGAEISLYERYQEGSNGEDTASTLSADRFEVWADQGNVLGVTIYPDEDNTNLVDNLSVQHFGLYAPEGATWSGQGTPTLTSDLGSGDYLTVATLPDASVATLEEFGQYAYNHVTDTQVDWQYNETDASGEPVSAVETTFTFDIEQKPESTTMDTLAGLFPHQYKHSDQALTGTTFWSPKGDLKLAATDEFTTTLRYPGILPFMPDAGTADQSQLQSYVDRLHNDFGPYEAQGVPNEAYWAGKDLMRNSAAIPIAEQLGDTGAKDYFLEAVQGRLETFFDVDTNSWSVEGQSFSTAEHEEFTYYHDDLGIFQTYPGGEFGAVEAINDHHLQFGYFIYVASEVARQNPQWAEQDQYGGIVELMIREYANPDHPDKAAAQDPSVNPEDAFPFLRTFSPYIGHSYAGGIQGNDWGANQESASEAVNAYAALIRWGEITGNEQLRDTGIYLYTHEITGMWEYWFDEDEDSLPAGWGADIEPPGYRAAATGNEFKYSPMAWDTGYWRNVYWNMSDAIELYGINWIPMGGHSFFLGKNQQYAQDNWDRMIDARSYFDGISDPQADFFGGWEQAAVGYRAMSDPADAVSLLDTELPMQPEGNSTPFTYQFAHVMNGLGTPDHTVVADTPFYQVFDDGTEKTYVAYNASDTSIVVNFSDGAAMEVPANSMATSDGSYSGGGGDTTAPTAPSNLTTTGTTDTSVSVSWDAASDSGGSGLLKYDVSLDGTVAQSVDVGTTSATLTGLAADTTYDISVAAVDGAGNTSAPTATVTATTDTGDTGGSGDVAAAINAGGDAVTVDGTGYAADANFSGGATASTGDAISGGSDALYQSNRWGADMSYEVPVSSGTYDVTLHFAETYWTSTGSRVFDVSVEGTTEITGLDIYAEVGHDAALTRTVSGVSPSGGSISISFAATADNPLLSGITIQSAGSGGDTTAPSAPSNLSVPATTESSVDLSWDPSSDSGTGVDHYNVYVNGSVDQQVAAGTTSATVTGLSAGTDYDVSVTAVDGAGNESAASATITATTATAGGSVAAAINCGGDAVTVDGTDYAADANFSGGSTDSTTDAISGTTADALYQSNRWGAWSYDIPVANGTYDVTLHFAELYWSSAGSRVFDVSVEGTTEISGLDVYAAAGSTDAAVTRTVSGVEVSDGTLSLSATASADNPLLSAITVVAADGSSGDTTAPTAPTTLSAPNVTEASVDLDWGAASDSGTAIDHYNVFVDGAKDQEVAAGTTTATVSGLSAGTSYDFAVSAVDGAGNESAQATVTASTASAAGTVVAAINCGGSALTAADGTQFAADTDFDGGATYSVSSAIADTDDDALYQSARQSAFGYDIPVENGTYEVRLHFAELYFSSSGSRLLSVDAEGTRVLTDYDIYAAAGGSDTATTETFTVNVTDGTLTLSIIAERDQAMLNGIEVVTA